MSKEFEEIKNDLNKINELMNKIIINWEKLPDKEFYKLAEEYPNYLPSFNEFKSDFNCWIESLK